MLQVRYVMIVAVVFCTLLGASYTAVRAYDPSTSFHNHGQHAHLVAERCLVNYRINRYTWAYTYEVYDHIYQHHYDGDGTLTGESLYLEQYSHAYTYHSLYEYCSPPGNA